MMSRRARAIGVFSLVAFMICVTANDLRAEALRTKGSVSRYDIATRNDLLFYHMVAPLMEGDVAELPILAGLADQVGDWVTNFIDAKTIANIITTSMSIEGQPVSRLDELVNECAITLGVDVPLVYIQNSPEVHAYSVQAYGRAHLILTRGLLELFEDRPEELKFIIGHELGHVLCDHHTIRRKAFGILGAIQAIDVAAVPDKYQLVLPTLALGRLLTWCREAEISADRAGLLCCGKPEIAYQAIMRLQHGLAPNSKWIDPEKDFDPEKVVKDFRQWQYEPFVDFILDIKRNQLEHPYIPERLAALKLWADSEFYRSILSRRASTQSDLLIEVVKIKAFELAPEGETVDPYVLAFDGQQQFLRTIYLSGARAGQWYGFQSNNKHVSQPRRFDNGQPLFFEIWDANYLDDSLIGGFVIYPDRRNAEESNSGDLFASYRTKIVWDWKKEQTISRAGFAIVQVRFIKPISRPGSRESNGQRKEKR